MLNKDDEYESITIMSSLYILRGCWNSREFVNILKNTVFKNGSVDRIVENTEIAKQYVDEQETKVLR